MTIQTIDISRYAMVRERLDLDALRYGQGMPRKGGRLGKTLTSNELPQRAHVLSLRVSSFWRPFRNVLSPPSHIHFPSLPLRGQALQQDDRPHDVLGISEQGLSQRQRALRITVSSICLTLAEEASILLVRSSCQRSFWTSGWHWHGYLQAASRGSCRATCEMRTV